MHKPNAMQLPKCGKKRSSIKSHQPICLICGRRDDKNLIHVNEKGSTVSASGTSLPVFLHKIVREEPCYSVSEVVCHQCYILLDRLDAYQARAAEILCYLTTRYKETKMELLGYRQKMVELIASSLSNINSLQNGTTLNVCDELSITVFREGIPKRNATSDVDFSKAWTSSLNSPPLGRIEPTVIPPVKRKASLSSLNKIVCKRKKLTHAQSNKQMNLLNVSNNNTYNFCNNNKISNSLNGAESPSSKRLTGRNVNSPFKSRSVSPSVHCSQEALEDVGCKQSSDSERSVISDCSKVHLEDDKISDTKDNESSSDSSSSDSESSSNNESDSSSSSTVTSSSSSSDESNSADECQVSVPKNASKREKSPVPLRESPVLESQSVGKKSKALAQNISSFKCVTISTSSGLGIPAKDASVTNHALSYGEDNEKSASTSKGNTEDNEQSASPYKGNTSPKKKNRASAVRLSVRERESDKKTGLVKEERNNPSPIDSQTVLNSSKSYVDPKLAEAVLMQNPLATSLLQSFLSTSLWFSSPEGTGKKIELTNESSFNSTSFDDRQDDLTSETLAVVTGSGRDKKVRQELKNTGQSYINTKGKLVAAKRVWPQDCSRCPFKCNQRVTEEDRMIIFAEYWGLGDYDLQRQYLASHMKRKEIVGPSGMLRTIVLYYLTHNEEKLRVCRQFFLKTLDVSEKASRIVLEKKVRGELGERKSHEGAKAEEEEEDKTGMQRFQN